MTRLRRWAATGAACAVVMVLPHDTFAQTVTATETPGVTDATAVRVSQQAGDAPERRRLRLSRTGRPTLTLPFGEIQLRGRVSGLLQSPAFDRGGNRPDPTWQTRRLQVEGTLFRRLEFEVSREFGDATEPERDMFANWRVSRALELRGGQFKMPFGRDALTGGGNLDFIARSFAGRQLAPGRDLGVMLHGRTSARHVAYQAGVFRRDGDNARTSQTHGGRRSVAARLVVTPLASSKGPLAGLQFGGALVTSRLDDQLGLRGRTFLDATEFFERVFVNGRRWRRGVEVGWAHGPVTLAGEYMTVSDQRLGMGVDDTDLPDVRATGWYVSGAWVLTGETKDGRVEPAHHFFGDGYGALELTARLERLGFDAANGAATAPSPLVVPIAPNADRAFTLGLSWYLTRHLKISGNAVFESVTDPERSPSPGDGRFPTAVVQFQAAL